MSLIAAVLRWLLVAVSVSGLVATVLPTWRTDTWWVRYLDYPRLQVTALLLAALLLMVSPSLRWRGRAWIGWGAAACLAAAVVWNARLLSPYLAPQVSAWPAPQAPAGQCDAGRRLRVLSVNVQMTNRQDRRLLDMVREADPDIAWFQEANDRWVDELAPLAETMPHSVAEARANYYGFYLLSKLPLQDAEVRRLTGSRNPSVFASVTLPAGGTVRLYALHPRPPQVGQGTAERDGQLMEAALAARGDTTPHVLLGDLNAVPWEGTFARLLRVGRFLDPRIGRGLNITWNANDVVAKWPLDHILPGPGLEVASYRVLPAFGSDHHPLLADLCLAPGLRGEAALPPADAADLQAAREAVQQGQGKAAGPGAANPLGSDKGPDDKRDD